MLIILIKRYIIMIFERVYLDEHDKDAYLDVYVADKIKDLTRKAILVIPGGGYGGVCAEREGEPIAMAFMPYGYNAFVLNYPCRKKPFPSHLIVASKAMKHIRDNAEKYNIDAQKVFAIGFSAGGHLAASLGTMWDKKEIYDEIDMPLGYNKPDGMMLIYPVLSDHYGSMQNLFMNQTPTEEELAIGNINNYVNENSAPAFIVHTSNDEIVPVKNSIAFADKLAEQGIKFELHIYPDGPHGVALGNQITRCGNEKWENKSIAKWVENAVFWANNL